MLNKLFPLVLLTLLNTLTLSAQDVVARFTTDKTDYLVAEPIFVALTVSNKGNKPTWVDLKSPNFLPFCHDFAIEVPGAESAQDQWGCGFAGSCGRGLREIPPAQSITFRQLLNKEFRLPRPGAYPVRAHTTIVVRNQNLFDSPEIDQLEVSDTLTIKLQRGSESQLEIALQPVVDELDSPDFARRSEAASAITELAPAYLEDVLIKLTKSNHAYAAVGALRKADTPKTREALAQLAMTDGDSGLRVEAINNLGRTKDVIYLPTLFRLMESDNQQIRNAAADAAGNMGGPTAVLRLVALASSPDEQTRIAGVNGLGKTHAREAVPILIQILLNSDANVRQAAVSSLWLLTQHAALNGNQWADVKNPQSAAAAQQRWEHWWNAHGNDSEMHGMTDCASPKPID